MREVDSRGKKCPQPIIDLARAMVTYPKEGFFNLLSDDVATWADLSAWSRMTGHEVERIDETIFAIVRKSS